MGAEETKMKFEIKHRFSGAILFSADADSLKLAVEAAVKSRADLSEADLSRANLYAANLSRADLSRADLDGADLSRANLSGAKNVPKYACTPLLMLYDQPGPIRAYKLVNEKSEGPYSGGLRYELGKSVEVADADTSEAAQCSRGISLATLDWCIRGWRKGYRILVAEFAAADIAAIPTATDGKFRVHRCRIVGEKDLAEIGLE
jgi:uncharacterized protein YjbI with pentapeptide repeats